VVALDREKARVAKAGGQHLALAQRGLQRLAQGWLASTPSLVLSTR
jgi:hypothetical protein